MIKLKKGVLVSIEGIDGSGKSSLCNILTDKLYQDGFDILKTKEPGATLLGKSLRNILQEREFNINTKAEFLLFAADRAQHFSDIVIPALESNKIVISDRMIDSTLAYQGYARGINLDFIKVVNNFSIGNIQPDLVVYLNLDYKTAMARLKLRAQKQGLELTYFEQEKEDFFKKVIFGFNTIFKDRKNVLEIDAKESIELISFKVIDYITRYLNNYLV